MQATAVGEQCSTNPPFTRGAGFFRSQSSRRESSIALDDSFTESVEVFPKGLPKALRISDSLFSLRRLLAAPGAPMDILIKSNDQKGPESQSDINTRPAELTHSNWPGIVEMYTKCRISYPKDKLIAISGIAGAMMPKLGTYASGLWKKSCI
jgi:hypothetical protein